MAKGWSFDTKARRYRSGETGRFIGKRQVTALRDAVVDAATREARGLAEQAARGEITAEAFRDGMRLAIRNAHAAEFIFGRGGVNSMTPSDFGRLGQTLRQQYAFLDRFASEIEAGTVSEAQASARATMYVNGGTRSFEQGQAAAWGLATALPCYPADGGTPCLTSCRCSWQIKETETAIEATWRVNAEACPGCVARGERYAPFVVPNWHAQPDTAPVRLSAIRRVA